MKEADILKYSMCLLFYALKITTSFSEVCGSLKEDFYTKFKPIFKEFGL